MTGAAAGILAIHPGAVGDVLLMGRLLAEMNQPSRVVVIGDKASLLLELGLAERAVEFDDVPFHELFAEGAACGLASAVGPAEWLISFFEPRDEVARKRLVTAVGARRADFLPIRPAGGERRHLLDVWADQMGLARPDWDRCVVRRPTGGGGVADGAIVLHAGAGGRRKCWPIQHFEVLADRVARRTGRRVVWTIGPVEADLWAGGVVEGLRARHNTLEGQDLPALARLLASAAAVVSNDSGPAHLAATLGMPTVALFGPTSPVHFAPRGPRVAVLQADPIERITPEQVDATLQGLGI